MHSDGLEGARRVQHNRQPLWQSPYHHAATSPCPLPTPALARPLTVCPSMQYSWLVAMFHALTSPAPALVFRPTNRKPAKTSMQATSPPTCTVLTHCMGRGGRRQGKPLPLSLQAAGSPVTQLSCKQKASTARQQRQRALPASSSFEDTLRRNPRSSNSIAVVPPPHLAGGAAPNAHCAIKAAGEQLAAALVHQHAGHLRQVGREQVGA